MAILKFIDGTEETVDYNTAAKVYQILEGNKVRATDKELERLYKLAEKTTDVKFPKAKR